MLAEYGEDFADEHRFQIPEGCHWSKTNKDRLPDGLLKDLIEHFSALSIGNVRVASDVMGDAYEYLIKQFADATSKKAGEFYTPRSVVRLIVDILGPKDGETIYDPSCGPRRPFRAAPAPTPFGDPCWLRAERPASAPSGRRYRDPQGHLRVHRHDIGRNLAGRNYVRAIELSVELFDVREVHPHAPRTPERRDVALNSPCRPPDR